MVTKKLLKRLWLMGKNKNDLCRLLDVDSLHGSVVFGLGPIPIHLLKFLSPI